MTTLQTLIRRAERDSFPAPSWLSDELRAAGKRVRITFDGTEQLLVRVDGKVTYRTVHSEETIL